MLLEELSELSLDTPDAAEVLGNFMARAVADDCIPPAYITNVPETAEAHAKYVVDNSLARGAMYTLFYTYYVCTYIVNWRHCRGG